MRDGNKIILLHLKKKEKQWLMSYGCEEGRDETRIIYII